MHYNWIDAITKNGRQDFETHPSNFRWNYLPVDITCCQFPWQQHATLYFSIKGSCLLSHNNSTCFKATITNCFLKFQMQVLFCFALYYSNVKYDGTLLAVITHTKVMIIVLWFLDFWWHLNKKCLQDLLNPSKLGQYIDGFIQERCNSFAKALELCTSFLH